MKIAYLANIRFPSERAHAAQIAHMCQAFVTNSTEVELFVNNRKVATSQSVCDFFGFVPIFKITRLRSGFFSHKILLSYYLSDVLFVLNFLLFKMWRQFDIVYSRNEWHIFYLSFFLSRKKLVWESHEARLNLPARYLLKTGVKTVVISEGIKEKYMKSGFAKGNFLVAHDGIDESFLGKVLSKESARKKLGLPLDKKIAMYIGGFDGWKGVETFFRVSNMVPDVLFVAIGGTVEQVAFFSKEYPAVTFLGSRPYAELRDNQQAADILVIPNSGKTVVSSLYTSPLKLFAHMASGVPIIASDVPSIVVVTGRELVSLIPPDNPEALMQSVEDIFLSLELRLGHAQRLRQNASNYTWTNRAKNVLGYVLN